MIRWIRDLFLKLYTIDYKEENERPFMIFYIRILNGARACKIYLAKLRDHILSFLFDYAREEWREGADTRSMDPDKEYP